MITRFSHLGLAVKNMDEALHVWRDVCGLEVVEMKNYPEIGFRNAIMRVGDDVYIELMESPSSDTEIGHFLEKRGEGMYHICLELDDIDKGLAELKAAGADVLEIPASESVGGKRGFLRRRFMHGVLIELVGKSDMENWEVRKDFLKKKKPGKKPAK